MARAAQQDIPKVALPSQQAEYVPPGPVTARGLSMKSKLIGGNSERTYAVICDKGDEVASVSEDRIISAGMNIVH